jgi:PPOX class probable F420-dependent enzyme
VSLTLNAAGRAFATERHLATLSTLAADGSLHVVPVGFTLVGNVARVITNRASQKVRNIRARGHATLSQVDGGRWLTLIGTGRIVEDPEAVLEAVSLYAARYRQPAVNPQRVAIEITVARLMGSSGLIDG